MFLGVLGNFEEIVILCDVINSSVMMWKINYIRFNDNEINKIIFYIRRFG